MECRHKFIMCRLCLCDSGSFIDIFQVNEWFGDVTAEVIRDLLQFQVSEMDGFPHVICSNCLGKLTDFKRFKENCQDSRDIYSDVFASDESNAEHAADIIGKCSLVFTSLEYLACHRKRTRDESCGPYESGVNDNGKPLPKRRKKGAVDAGPCENTKSSGSARVKVGEMDIKGRRDRKSSGKRAYVLPFEEGDVNRAESSVGESRRETMNGQKDVNRVDVSVDVALGGEGMRESNPESDNERREAAPLAVNERERERFKCKECGKDFAKKDALMRHLELHGYVLNESTGEESESQVDANVNCGSNRNADEVLKKGLKGKMSDSLKKDQVVRNYICYVCGKGFRSKGHVSVHLRMHTGEKPFVCTLCGKRFSQKTNLGIHKLTHTGEKPFGCEVCGRRFAQKFRLTSHGWFHSGEQPYLCEICGKKFADKSNLSKHSRIHSGEKPHTCQACNKCFSGRSSLRRHLRIHSREKP